MTQAEYNAKIQEIQRMWTVDGYRFSTSRDSAGKIIAARFQVYWDGWWHTLGVQTHPFTATAEYEWDDDADIVLRGKFADALART